LGLLAVTALAGGWAATRIYTSSVLRTGSRIRLRQALRGGGQA
jgi:hypothetical protein